MEHSSLSSWLYALNLLENEGELDHEKKIGAFSSFGLLVIVVIKKGLQSLPWNVVIIVVTAGATGTPGFLFSSIAVLLVIAMVRGTKRLRRREKT